MRTMYHLNKHQRTAVRRYLTARHMVTQATIGAYVVTMSPRYVPSGLRTIYPNGDRGATFTNQLLADDASPVRIYTITRMNPEAFKHLVDWLEKHTQLRGSRKDTPESITIHQKLLIFLYICAQGASFRLAGEMFSHSTRTISV